MEMIQAAVQEGATSFYMCLFNLSTEAFTISQCKYLSLLLFKGKNTKKNIRT